MNKKQIDRKYLANLYNKQGLSGIKIANMIGRSKYAIYRIFTKLGIEKRKRTSKYLLLNDTGWLIRQYKNKSIRQIARENGMTVGNIHAALKSRGIKIRKNKESLKMRYPNGRYGELSSNWKGGVTKISHNIRTSAKYKEWRLSVLGRDNYTCQICGKKGKDVDHKKQFALILAENNIKTREDSYKCKELWDVNNGRTLCRPCHLATKTYSKRVN